MKFTCETYDRYTLIRIEGSMSDDFLREIRTAFEDALSRDASILVDIVDVSFISSSGLGLLFNSNSRLKCKGKKLVVYGAKEEIRRLFSVTRMDSHALVTETFEESVGKI